MNEWHNNSDSTPEFGVEVLVYCGDGKHPSMFICWFSENRGWVTDSNVTHWMPLPDPPGDDQGKGS